MRNSHKALLGATIAGASALTGFYIGTNYPNEEKRQQISQEGVNSERITYDPVPFISQHIGTEENGKPMYWARLISTHGRTKEEILERKHPKWDLAALIDLRGVEIEEGKEIKINSDIASYFFKNAGTAPVTVIYTPEFDIWRKNTNPQTVEDTLVNALSPMFDWKFYQKNYTLVQTTSEELNNDTSNLKRYLPEKPRRQVYIPPSIENKSKN